MAYKLTVSIRDANMVARIKEYALERGVSISSMIDNYFMNIVKTMDIDHNRHSDLPKELDELIGSLHTKNSYIGKGYKELRNEMYEDRAEKYL
ncbi:MAG: DUF6364 family protein [Bacteroidota bacterium]|nr:DUF6364 family protein [Bacteroidota bacterium]